MLKSIQTLYDDFYDDHEDDFEYGAGWKTFLFNLVYPDRYKDLREEEWRSWHSDYMYELDNAYARGEEPPGHIPQYLWKDRQEKL